MSEAVKVEGMDAFMIYADDPRTLADWYDRHLGIGTNLAEDGNRYGEVADTRAGKAMHMGIYPSQDGHPSRRRSVMMNFRVADLDACVTKLRADGVAVHEVIDEGYGKFAYLSDPEGHPVELWQKVKTESTEERGDAK